MAVRALHGMGRLGPSGAHLVLAGGYDERLRENRDYFTELQSLVTELGLGDQVVVSDTLEALSIGLHRDIRRLPLHVCPFMDSMATWG